MAKLRIHRKGYTRKGGVRVAPANFMIRDRGLPGRGKRFFTLREGRLTKYGYVTSAPSLTRHAALNKAVRAYGPLTVFKMLNALYVLNTRTSPTTSRIAKSDRNWVKAGYMKR